MNSPIIFIFKLITLLCLSLIHDIIFGNATVYGLSCWMGYTVESPAGNDASFEPLHELNCTGEGMKCISTACLLDDSISSLSVRYHSCARDSYVWCRAHAMHCDKMFNGSTTECIACERDLCNVEKDDISAHIVTICAIGIGVLLLLGLGCYLIKAWYY